MSGIPRFMGEPRHPTKAHWLEMQSVGVTLAPPPVPSSAGGAGGTPGAQRVSGFRMLLQEQSNWCWASVTQAILARVGTAMGQGDVATAHLSANGNSLACTGPFSGHSGAGACAPTPACAGSCNDRHIIRHILEETGQFRATLSTGGVAPSFQQIQQEIGQQRPVVVVINWPNGAGHFIAVSGWQVSASGEERVEVHDPKNGVAGQAIPAANIRYNDLAKNYAISGSGGTAVFSYAVM